MSKTNQIFLKVAISNNIEPDCGHGGTITAVDGDTKWGFSASIAVLAGLNVTLGYSPPSGSPVSFGASYGPSPGYLRANPFVYQKWLVSDETYHYTHYNEYGLPTASDNLTGGAEGATNNFVVRSGYACDKGDF